MEWSHIDRSGMSKLGLSGVLTNGHTLGQYLDEPQFRPVWADRNILQPRRQQRSDT